MSKEIKINVGSGAIGKFRRPGYVGYDKQDFGQEIVDNALNIQKHFKKGTVTEIVAQMMLEHLTYDEAVKFFNKCWNLLKDDGKIEIEVPAWNRGKAYEFTHKSFYSEDTFGEMENEEHCCECGLKPFKIEELYTNGKGNIYCILRKVKDYVIKLRKKI